MSGFEMKPLDLTDFSGGLTDNFLTAGPTHYYMADNLYITTDKNLQERNGTRIIDTVAYSLPGGPKRVAGLYTFINDSILLAQSSRTIYYYNQNVAFQPILGPSGNETLGAGDAYSAVVSAEWNKHMYFASDAQPNPAKIYRDSTNTFQARTVGLPRVIGSPNITTDQILGKAINLANDVRQSMVAHIQDTGLHSSLDLVALNYFIAQDFSGGGEQPPAGVVPQGPCTDQASLFLLIGNINAAYEHQRADASQNGSRVYHTNIGNAGLPLPAGSSFWINPTGMHVRLANTSTPTALLTAASQIDDIAQKWYWHRLGVWVHSPINDYNAINIYPVTKPKVGTQNTGQPVITGNLTDVFNFANNTKFLFNTHINDYGAHTSLDGLVSGIPFRINLADAIDYDSYANMVFWIRCLYYQHNFDASSSIPHRLITMDSTIFTPNVTNVNFTTPPSTAAFFPTNNAQNWIYTYGGPFPAFTSFTNGRGVYIVSSGSGTATLSGNSQTGATGITAQVSQSQQHVALDSSGNGVEANSSTTSIFTPPTTANLATQVDFVGTDAKTWLALASEVFYSLVAHLSDSTIHVPISTGFAPRSVTSILGGPAAFSPVYPYLPLFIPTIASYVYGFIFSDSYVVEPNGITYLVQSNPIFVGPVLTSTIIPPNATVLSQNVAVYPNATYKTVIPTSITNIPGITNTPATNYNTAGLTCDIYRSTDGGTTFYKLTSLANGTTTYSDVTSDAVSYTGFNALTTNQTLYTTGGVVGNDQPPPSGCIATLNGYMYYGNIVDTGQNFPNRIRQSLVNNPDSAPATFFDDLEDAVVAVASTRSVVIALCQRSIYRLSGNFNLLGQGLITHEKISDAMGCVSAKSVVKTEIGIFFAGTDGFYYTDGYQLIKISLELNTRYASFTQTVNQQKRISGAYNRFTRKVIWTLQTNPTDTNPDMVYAFYLDYGVKPGGVFTNILANFAWVRPASVATFKGNLVYGHELGYVMTEDPNNKTDPKVDTTKVPSLWNDVYIPYNYTSAALDFGSLFNRKWTTKIHYLGNNIGNIAVQFTSIRDNDASIPGLLPIVNFTYNPMWGDPKIIWNKPSSQQPYNWEYDTKIDVWRRFPAGNLRCDLKQIIATPAFLAVYRSQDWPPFCFASTNSGTKVVTIATPTGFTNIVWPLDIIDMFFAFSTDNYVKTYLITAVSGNTATVTDPNNTLTTVGNLGWVIRGYKKGQRLNLNSIIIYYDYLGDKNSAYVGKTSAGENG